MRASYSIIVVGLCTGFLSAGEASPVFVKKPTAVRAGPKTTIAFTLDRPTDVAVAIEDAQGKIIRHLAAGVLGKNPPPPLQPNTLAQSLEWDGKDDFGKPTADGAFEVRVRAGTGVQFSRLIGADPYAMGRIHSVAVDEDGRLYIMAYQGGLNQNMDTLRIFASDGSYLRTLIPFAAHLPPEKARAMASWDPDRKTFLPKNGRSQMPEFYPWGAGARLVSASIKDGIVLVQGHDLYRMDSDGGDVRGPFPMWSKAAKLDNPGWNVPQLAVSLNGQSLYIANVAGTKYQPKQFSDTSAAWPQGRVYRQDTSPASGDPRKFFDLELPDWTKDKYWLPDAWNKRTAAYGITVDRNGHVYVCDLVNQAIVEVDASGKQLTSTKVSWPERVHVDPTSGSYYVICRLDRPRDGAVGKKLVKIEGRGVQGRVVAELPLKQLGLGDTSALGRFQGQPAVWIAGAGSLICVKDAGGRLEIVPTAFRPREDSQQDWNRIAVDYQRDEIYTSDGTNLLYRYDVNGVGGLLTKAGKPFHGVDVAIGYDGLLYCRTGPSFSGPLERFDRDLKPAPFASGTHVLSPYIYSRYGVGNSEHGLGVGPRGESYISFMYGWNKYFVAGFDGDGKPLPGQYLRGKIPTKSEGNNAQAKGLDSAVIGPLPASNGGIRVDLAGNIYVGLRLQPKDFLPPKELAQDPAYATWTGSIVKFGPDGGTVLGAVKEDDPVGAEGEPTTGAMKLVGAKAIYPGIAPFSGGGFGGGGSSCVCRVPRFDLDRFGRIIFTNAVTNSVAIIDNAGNLIVNFGSYGNFDSQYSPNGNKPLVNEPMIPLAWPTGAGFGRDYLYVNDTYNRRVVQVRQTYTLDAVVTAK
jgi:hypothetical protein